MEPKTEKIGKLDNIVYSGDPQSDVTFVFHGFGADAGDLVPLKPYLGLEKSTWVFPNGRLEVPIAPGFFGRAWWPIDMAEVEKAMQAGGFRDLMSQRPQNWIMRFRQ